MVSKHYQTKAAAALGLCALLWAAPAQAQPREEAPLLRDLGDEPQLAQPQPGQDPSAPPEEMVVAEFGLDERNVVLSAARSRSTIQEVPAIVTVITADEIRSRGYRTLNDLLQTVPGFEGDRWEFNGWTQESFSRGNPRTLLVLLNGVNIVDPSRSQATLDRKIPMEAIARVEIVSGPGGVLWGSNALLGVVNVITKNSDDLDGFEVIMGGGDGPGERQAGKLALSWGGQLWGDRVKLWTLLSLFTSLGPELTLDNPKVVGILPAPADDGIQLFAPGQGTTTDPSREYYLNWMGQLTLADALTLEWMLPLERDARQISGTGALLSQDLRADQTVAVFDTETIADDKVATAALRFQDRFLEDRFGLSAKLFAVKWSLEEDPLGVFPPSDASPRLNGGVFTRIQDEGIWRFGLNLDMDLALTTNQKLIFGGELFQDRILGAKTTAPISDQVVARLNEEQQQNLFTEQGVTFLTENLINPITRTTGALYLVDEWEASGQLAFSAGARYQLFARDAQGDDAREDLDQALLLSGAMVWNLLGDAYLKLNYAEGIRPPEYQATDINGDAVNQITFQPNPDLGAERSRAGEVELNAVLLKGRGVVNRLYLRADYSVTLLDDIIVNQGGRFANSGTRLIHSAELLARLELQGGHELWAAYTFVDVDDSELGKLRNIANHIGNVGGRAVLWPDRWDASLLLTVIGPREDRNRAVDPNRDPFLGYVPVYPTDIFIERLEPVALLRLGTRVLNLWDTWTLSAFVYNALNQTWQDPDLFFDDGYITRPYPKPRWSFFLQAEARFDPFAEVTP
jgi:outer membrane receptor protein involved in Fe transport